MLPVGSSDAQTMAPEPTLNQLVLQAKQLSNQVTSLGQQYDGLKIELQRAQSEEQYAEEAVKRDDAAMAGDQQAVSQLAAGTYMTGGLDPTLNMLASGSPEQFLDQASIVQELNTESGLRLSSLTDAQQAAQRAELAAKQQIAQVTALNKQMSSKLDEANSKMAVLDSSAMAQALAVYQQTGSYPNYTLPLVSNVETIALRWALTRIGDPYVWAAAGPDAFDCSGLVVWAYAQEGISLPHYTGDLWNDGEHVSENDLQAGDLVFFYADISHVGIYIGNGLMVDAPAVGQDVMIQPLTADPYVGAVRI
jgi:cell wall-associated NlpC family hydrolase